MQYSDGYKENTYLTWKGEKYRVTPEFESLSFYDERDGDVSLYCISLTDDWHKEERYPCWDAFCGIDGPLSESLVEQWICDYESQSGGLEYGDGRFEHYGWNSQDKRITRILPQLCSVLRKVLTTSKYLIRLLQNIWRTIL